MCCLGITTTRPQRTECSGIVSWLLLATIFFGQLIYLDFFSTRCLRWVSLPVVGFIPNHRKSFFYRGVRGRFASLFNNDCVGLLRVCVVGWLSAIVYSSSRPSLSLPRSLALFFPVSFFSPPPPPKRASPVAQRSNNFGMLIFCFQPTRIWVTLWLILIFLWRHAEF